MQLTQVSFILYNLIIIINNGMYKRYMVNILVYLRNRNMCNVMLPHISDLIQLNLSSETIEKAFVDL